MGPYRFGAYPGQQQARQVAEGQLVVADRVHVEREWPVDALVLKAVAGVASRQGAERHCAAHETKIGVRFAGPDQLVHLIEAGESPLRRWWGFAERLDRPIQAGENFGGGNQAVLFTLHGSFSHVPQTRQGPPVEDLKARL